MIERWTGRVIGEMHNCEITFDELANELGVTKNYISMILNCKRKPKDIKSKIENAVKVIKERKTKKCVNGLRYA